MSELRRAYEHVAEARVAAEQKARDEESLNRSLSTADTRTAHRAIFDAFVEALPAEMHAVVSERLSKYDDRLLKRVDERIQRAMDEHLVEHHRHEHS